ncbi:small acid-soluble spore protein [Xylanibacillus composti]|uniref:Small acid-soluble spore protein alpha/beta type n=1 Tax=Xylanibacillus composti TaxID=1572762 RepID=A0A8J4H1J2_9BACL|nr:alpha/beta-type small acid-soluble spore protein [Xylanibacillus composti]MDT9725629.1 small acid-soluble spore protein [Xylanibacillus composti]GIQ67722.1 hypothetical protein XYCOK13_05460 [Xylanibacillus composti]
MARRRRAIMPQAEEGLRQFKGEVMRQYGYVVHPERPDAVKFEVARSLGVPMQRGYNGHLTSEDAGRVGGKIGGAMVREMIRQAQSELARKHQPD